MIEIFISSGTFSMGNIQVLFLKKSVNLRKKEMVELILLVS